MASSIPTPEEKTSLETEEQNLRIQKLQGEVAALRKPEWTKLSTWTGIVAIAAAIFSFVVQGYYYKIENKEAKNDLRDIKDSIKLAKIQEDSIRAVLIYNKDSVSTAISELNYLFADNTKFKKALDSIHRIYDSVSRSALSSSHPSSAALSQINQVLKDTRAALTTEVMSIPKSKSSDTTATKPTSTAISPDSNKPFPIVPDDPQKNQWGGLPERNGRKMSATIKQIGYHTYQIVITVTSTNPADRLNGDVTFHLHNTFRNQNPVVPVTNGEAALSLVAVGSFRVGATLDKGQTKLEFDLVNAPGADEYFRTH